MPQFAPKNKPYLEASQSPKVSEAECFEVLGFTGMYSPRYLGSASSFRRYIADEDPDPEGFMGQSGASEDAMAKREARICTNKHDTTKQCVRKFVES